MPKKLSEEEIKEVKICAAKSLKKLESIFENHEHNEKINTFINKFVVCEQIYKIAFCRVKDKNVIRSERIP